MESSRLAWATKEDPVSKQTNELKKKKKRWRLRPLGYNLPASRSHQTKTIQTSAHENKCLLLPHQLRGQSEPTGFPFLTHSSGTAASAATPPQPSWYPPGYRAEQTWADCVNVSLGRAAGTSLVRVVSPVVTICKVLWGERHNHKY